MGGNALKNCETRRVSAEEYEVISKEVVDLLNKLNDPEASITPIISYSSKPDFGDIDVLFEIRHGFSYTDLASEISKAFNSKEIVPNGNCISAEYKGFHVDVIKTPTPEFHTSVVYFAYNDLGNLMGRIAHKMGFKYGHRGLVYQFRTTEDHVFEEVIVSTNMSDIFKFMGYDFPQWERGFNTVEEIFIFASSSPYFNKQIFLLKNRGHISRIRDKKRKNYGLFLKWVEDRGGLPEYPWPSMDERGGRRASEEFLQKAFNSFPSFSVKYGDVVKRVEAYNKYKSLFSGDHVRTLTRLEGVELGDFIKYLKHWGTQCLEGSIQGYIIKLGTQDRVDAFIRDSLELRKGFRI